MVIDLVYLRNRVPCNLERFQ